MIGKTIKLFREDNKLSQTELATKLSITTSYLKALEADRSEPSVNLLWRLADAFKIRLSELVVAIETMSGISSLDRSRGLVKPSVYRILRQALQGAA